MSAALPARLISFSVRTRAGEPTRDAIVRIFVDGRAKGLVHTGTGVTASTIALDNPDSQVDLEATAGGQTEHATMLPGQDSHTFILESVGLVKSVQSPVARCPDGTTGSPCVTCHDGAETWRICA